MVQDFKAPDGLSPAEVDANGDGELLVVLDLRPHTDLQVCIFNSERCATFSLLWGPKRPERGFLSAWCLFEVHTEVVVQAVCYRPVPPVLLVPRRLSG